MPRSASSWTPRLVVALSVALSLAAVPSRAPAWQILSAVTDPCHEQMSFSAIEGIEGLVFPGDTSGIPDSALFPPPNARVDSSVVGVATMIGDEMGVTFDSDRTALAALSVFVGCRHPDITEGSPYDFSVLRAVMLVDDHEHSHFIRRSYDDGPGGDASAAADARALIREEIDLAILSARGPLEDRFVSHVVSVDFYGDVDLPLYEPMYRLGRALHTFEDSFSHTLRSDDLRSIVSIMNSIDALSGQLEESRDGIAHSMAMDRCMDDASGIAPVAAGAVRELAGAVSAAVDPAMEHGIDEVFDKWLGLTPGCTFDNNYCDASWLEVARRDPYGPMIPMFLGCGTAPAGNPWMLILMLIPVVAFRARRNR